MHNLIYKYLKRFIQPQEVCNGQLELAITGRKLLHIFQFWPEDNRKLSNKIRCSIVFLLGHFVPLGFVGHIVKYAAITNHFRFHEIALEVSFLVSCLAGFQFGPAFYFNQARANHLLKELGDFREYTKPEGIEMHDAVLGALLKFTNLSVFAIAPIMFTILIFEECPNELDFQCGLAFSGYIPGLMSQNGRKIYLILQMLTGWPFAILGFSVLWFYLQMSEFIILYLKQLTKILLETPYIQVWEVRQNHMKYALRYHHHILELYDEYAKITKGTFVIYAVWIPIILGIMSYGLLVKFEIEPFGFFFLWTVSLFIACWFGQRLISEELTMAVYNSVPFDGDVNTTKYLMLILVRSQRSLFIPAGSLTYCGYELFVTVIQSTYSYLTLLQSTGKVN